MTEHNALFYHEIMLVHDYAKTGSQFCIVLWELNRKKTMQYCLGIGKETKVIWNIHHKGCSKSICFIDI